MSSTSPKFQRNIENFVCEHCGFNVKGNGYTNHCPSCLWSKHVDINPGDRQEQCQGTMKPMGVELQGQEYIIIHKCVKCGVVKRNKSSKEDNFEEILKLVPKNLP